MLENDTYTDIHILLSGTTVLLGKIHDSRAIRHVRHTVGELRHLVAIIVDVQHGQALKD